MIGFGVTGLAASGIRGPVAVIIDVRVVTGGAVHFAAPETLTGSQQRQLIAMDIRLVGPDMRRHRKLRKRISGPEGEQGPQLDIIAARVAYSA